jgi:hypothetical protein
MSEMNLKVGDELAFHYHHGPGCPYVISTITKITPTGIIKCGDISLNPDLTVKGDRGWSFPREAKVVTDAIRLEIRRWNAAYNLKHANWDKVDAAVLFAVLDLIENKKKEAEHA